MAAGGLKVSTCHCLTLELRCIQKYQHGEYCQKPAWLALETSSTGVTSSNALVILGVSGNEHRDVVRLGAAKWRPMHVHSYGIVHVKMS